MFGALAFSLLLAAAYGWEPVIPLAGEHALAFPTQGFYPLEQGAGVSFAWTGRRAEISLPGLDRHVEWHWTANVLPWRPLDRPATVQIAVDGVVQLTQRLGANIRTLEANLPSRAGFTGATLTIDTIPTFVPGAADTRELGVALGLSSIAPTRGRPLPPYAAIAYGAGAVFILGVTLALLEWPWMWTLSALLAVSVAQVLLFLRRYSLHTTYPVHAAVLAAGIGLGAWLSVRLLERARGSNLSIGARAAVAFSVLACYLKLLVLLNPTAPIGDGLFHAHRFEYVLDGRFYFTSIAPGNYSFPYPVLLYVIAAPFSFFTHDTLERVALLRIIVTVADAAAGTLLYWMIVRSTANRLAGVAAVVWYHLIPMTAWIMTWGNLTNAFGQTLFVASLAAVVALPVERLRRPIVTLTVLACGALLSHPSTCAILLIVLGVTAGLYAWRGGRPLAGSAFGVCVAAAAAALIAFVLYYAWFPAIYVSELSRALAESGTHLATAAPDWTMSSRIASIPALAGSYLGWPAMFAATVGAWRLKNDVSEPRLAWLLAGWTGACVFFLVLGVVTPVQMRTHFALFPALAITAAFGCVWAWRGPFLLRAGAVTVVGADMRTELPRVGAARDAGALRWLALILFVLASAGGPTAQSSPSPKTLQIYIVDVEGGNATLFVGPTGESLLVDTGNGGPQGLGPANAVRDAGRIMAAASDAGLTQIDHLITTHWHSDHFGGMVELASRIPIRHFIDHGPNAADDFARSAADEFLPKAYAQLHGGAKRTVVKPGDRVPVAGLDILVVASAGNVITNALTGGGRSNAYCSAFRPGQNNAEDPLSVGILVAFGAFRAVHLGDLTKNKEFELMCPTNRIGTVDVLLGLHHGVDSSNSEVLVHALRPRVAIMNNGIRKGGPPEVMRIVHSSPGLEDLWQTHFSELSGQEYTVPGMFIANQADEPLSAMPVAPSPVPQPGAVVQAAPVHNGPAFWIKVSAQTDGTFAVANQRNGFTKSYSSTREK